MTRPTSARIAILGAGPIGLEAALYAQSLGYEVSVYDRGQVGDHVQRWGFVRMFTPFGMNTTPLGKTAILRDNPTRELPADTDLFTGRDYRESYLMPLAESSTLKGCVHSQTKVVAIGRCGWRKGDPPLDPRKPLPPFRILLRDANNQERIETCEYILDCTGTFARPNAVGDGGIPAIGESAALAGGHLAYWPDDILGPRKAHYAGKSVIVIGGGYSAATTVCDLATLAEDEQATWVIWLTRGPRGSQPLPRIASDPLKERDRLAVRANALASRGDGNLEFHPQTVIDELIAHGPDQGFRVSGRLAGKPMSWDAERVIALVGYRPDLGFCSELRLSEPTGTIDTGEPGYFVLGAKSKGRDSNFLIRDGHEQIRKVFVAIAGKPGLDLYAKKSV